jgi:cell division transport system ATP-binding protein
MNALKIVGLVSRRNQMPHHLSGGEQQRVSIARAIANEPLLLLADEPTGNLDKQISNEILNIFIELNNKGTTVIMATHDEELIAKYNKRSIKLDRGNLIYDKKCTENN